MNFRFCTCHDMTTGKSSSVMSTSIIQFEEAHVGPSSLAIRLAAKALF